MAHATPYVKYLLYRIHRQPGYFTDVTYFDSRLTHKVFQCSTEHSHSRLNIPCEIDWIKRICLRLDMLEKNTSILSTKVNSDDIANEVNTLAENLKDLKKRLDNLSKLDDIVEECRKKIEDLEKSRRSRHR